MGLMWAQAFSGSSGRPCSSAADGRNMVSRPMAGRNEQMKKTCSIPMLSAIWPRMAAPIPPKPKATAKKQARNHADTAWQKFLSINHHSGEGRGEDEANGHGENDGPEQVGERQRECERQGAEHREPDDGLAAYPVAYWATENGSSGEGKKIDEKIILRMLGG